jgi:ABC-2 type transport system permease protein
MEIKKAFAIAVKDLTEVFSSPSIYGPMLGVPIFFSLMLPLLTFYATKYAASSIASKIAAIPAAATAAAGASPANGLLVMSFTAISVLGPIFLTMPILTASVIAADSFAGEKERKTSEALLATPIKTNELLLGKIIASFIPAVLLTIAVFAIYGYVTNWLSLSTFHQTILPTPSWLLMLATSPFLAVAAIGIIVLVSSHVKGIKEAQQISTLLILPVLVMPFVSILGLASLTVSFFIWFIVFLAIADMIIVYVGVRTFKKENML